MEYHICKVYMGQSWKWHTFLLIYTLKARTRLCAPPLQFQREMWSGNIPGRVNRQVIGVCILLALLGNIKYFQSGVPILLPPALDKNCHCFSFRLIFLLIVGPSGSLAWSPLIYDSTYHFTWYIFVSLRDYYLVDGSYSVLPLQIFSNSTLGMYPAEKCHPCTKRCVQYSQQY